MPQNVQILNRQLTCVPEVKTITVCEYNPLKIQCPAYLKIEIISGFYGRTDKITCVQGWTCINCNTACSLDITNKLSNSFNGKNSFEVIINNEYAGRDPCFYTYKYSNVRYTCI